MLKSALGMKAVGKIVGLVLRNRSALSALIVRGLGICASFALTFIIARWFGPEASGTYALITQTAIFLAVVAVGGLDLAIVREFSRGVASALPIARSSILGVLGQTLALAGLIGGIIFAIEPIAVPRLLGEHVIANAAVILALLIVIRAEMRIIAAILRSQGLFSTSQAIDLFLLPVLTIALLVAWQPEQMGVNAILVATVLAGLLVIGGGFVLVLKLGRSGSEALRIPQRGLFISALPMWGMAISQNIADWYSLVTLSHGAGIAEAGIYRVCWQIAAMLPMVAISLQGTFTAQIATALHSRDMAAVARLSRTATNLSLLVFGPIAVLIFIFAEPVLTAFGEEFTSGYNTLRVLLAGQFVLAGFGIAGQTLIMAGHARLNLVINIATTAVILGAAPIAAKAYGGLGVAMLLAAVSALKASVYFFALLKLEGFNAFTGKVRRQEN